MRIRIISLIKVSAALACSCCLLSVYAASRPVIGIELTINDPMYEEYYDATDYQKFKDGVLKKLNNKLSSQIGFLKFEKNPDYAIVLKVSIDAASEDAGPDLREIGFFFKITGANLKKVLKPDFVYLRLRRGEDYGDVGEVQNEINRIEQELDDFSFDEIVSNLLHRVPIAKRAKYLESPFVGWVIPYGKRDICIEKDSLIEVTLKLNYPQYSEPVRETYAATAHQNLKQSATLGEWGGKMFGRAKQPDIIRGYMTVNPGRSNVVVERVYIKQYFRLQDCGETKPVDVNYP